MSAGEGEEESNVAQCHRDYPCRFAFGARGRICCSVTGTECIRPRRITATSDLLALQHMFQPDHALLLVKTFFVWFIATQLAVAMIAGLGELSRLF